MSMSEDGFENNLQFRLRKSVHYNKPFTRQQSILFHFYHAIAILFISSNKFWQNVLMKDVVQGELISNFKCFFNRTNVVVI